MHGQIKSRKKTRKNEDNEMKEIFLLKLGEIVLKGANKRQFESKLR